MQDLVGRQDAIEVLDEYFDRIGKLKRRGLTKGERAISLDVVGAIRTLPSAQPEPHEIGYSECANSMLKMWIDNVLTDGEYSHIMDKLNAYWAERRVDEGLYQQI